MYACFIFYSKSSKDVYMATRNVHIICVCFSNTWKAGLEKIWEVRPMINGSDIMSVLQLKTGGPVVKEWVRQH